MNNNNSKHTQGELKILENYFGSYIIGTDEKRICQTYSIECKARPIRDKDFDIKSEEARLEGEANANRIVECVNGYEALIKQNAELLEALKVAFSYMKDLDKTISEGHLPRIGTKYPMALEADINSIEVTIQSATN